VIVDPAHLDNSLDSYTEEKVEQYAGLSRMVNRNDETVSAVFVAGRAVFRNGQPIDLLGKQRTGSFLRANTTTPAATGPSWGYLASHQNLANVHEHQRNLVDPLCTAAYDPSTREA
jgi:hypothetical protein